MLKNPLKKTSCQPLYTQTLSNNSPLLKGRLAEISLSKSPTPMVSLLRFSMANSDRKVTKKTLKLMSSLVSIAAALLQQVQLL